MPNFNSIPTQGQWSGETLEHLTAGRVYLNGEIDEGTTVEGYLDLLADDPVQFIEIDLIIETPGGAIDSGLGIIRAIQRLQAKEIRVKGIVRGMAASMGLTILQACDSRVMSEGDMLMAHGSTTQIVGDSQNLTEEGKLLDTWHDYFGVLYGRRTKRKPADWVELFKSNARNYYTAKEALEEGLVDEVL